MGFFTFIRVASLCLGSGTIGNQCAVLLLDASQRGGFFINAVAQSLCFGLGLCELILIMFDLLFGRGQFTAATDQARRSTRWSDHNGSVILEEFALGRDETQSCT